MKSNHIVNDIIKSSSIKKSEPPENVAKRGREFYERMKKKGYVRFYIWTPKKFKEKIREFVKFLKDKD